MVGKVSGRSFVRSHPLIVGLLEEDDRRRERQSGSSFHFSSDAPLFDSPFERRRLRILDRLFLALQRCGSRPWVTGIDMTSAWRSVLKRPDRYIIRNPSELIPDVPPGTPWAGWRQWPQATRSIWDVGFFGRSGRTIDALCLGCLDVIPRPDAKERSRHRATPHPIYPCASSAMEHAAAPTAAPGFPPCDEPASR